MGDYYDQREEITIEIVEPNLEIINEQWCEYCGSILPDQEILMEHIAKVHTQEYRFFCEECGQGFFYFANKLEHQQIVHDKAKILKKQPPKVKQDKFTCSLCKIKFNCNSFLQDHIVRVHTKDFRFFCQVCNMGFYLNSRLMYHMKKYHEIDPKKMRKQVTARSREIGGELLETYMTNLEKTANGRVRCPVPGCNKIVSSKGNLVVHLDSHENQKYICEYCSKVYTHYPSLERHIKWHTNGKQTFSCDICQKVLTTSSNLRYHKRIHTGEKPAQCEECGKGFTCVRDLNIHRKKQHDFQVVKFECLLCDKKFTIYGKLRQHYAKYHPDNEIPDEYDN